MPYDIDSANPADSSLVSAFPSDEQDSRAAIEGALSVEHDHTVGGTGTGRHKIGVGDIATRDAITDWVNGSLWVNTQVVSGKHVLEVCTDNTPPDPYVWVTTDIEILDVNNQWFQGQYGWWQLLTDDITVVSDWTVSNAFYFTTTQDFTLADPTPPSGPRLEYQTATYYIKQDADPAARVITWGAGFVFLEGIEPILSTAPDAIDVLHCVLLPDLSIMVSVTHNVGT